MTEDELLALKFGGHTVSENIQRAIDAGDLVRKADGHLRLARASEPVADWARVAHGPNLDCKFKFKFLFEQVYAKSAVPYGCSACYKVKIVPRTLRQLVAAWGIGKKIKCRSKWGTDIENRYSQDVYAGYFYLSGLEPARALYRVVREIIDSHPTLGPEVAMSIKRGCSDYEAAVGPSDQYSFAPELGELEAYLREQFCSDRSQGLPPQPMARWLDVAFRIGDDTYLDFTQGKRLRPKTVAYTP
jgi:hypothetical protein